MDEQIDIHDGVESNTYFIVTDQMVLLGFGSFLAGVLLTLLVQIWIFAVWFFSLPVDTPEEVRSQYIPFRLPKEIKLATEQIDPNKTEDFLCMNVLMQFIFQENKDTVKFRSWVMDKVHLEFDDLLKSMAGKMLHHLSVRDMNVGSELPTIGKLRLLKIDTKNGRLEEVVIEAEVTYSGGFQIGVNVSSFLGRAFFAVVVSKLVGTIHIKLTREPFTHWSVAFVKDPLLEFDVESQYLGRQFSKITSFITNLFRRMVRKKHTLPNFKIRYRPFFTNPRSNRPDKIETLLDGKSLTRGKLEVKVLEITRLRGVDTDLYFILTIDDQEWSEKNALPPAACLPSCIKKNNGLHSVSVEENSEYVNIHLNTSTTAGATTAAAAVNQTITSTASSTSLSTPKVAVSQNTSSSSSPVAPTIINAGSAFSAPLRRVNDKLIRRDYKEEDDYNKSEIETEIENILNDKELCVNLLNETGKEFEQESSDEMFSLPSCNCHRMRKSNIYKPSRDITCNQVFTFEGLTEFDRYINITIVQYTPPVKDKVGRILIRDKHVPMAYISMSLNDIATQCLVTKQSNTLQCVQLNMAPGISKTINTKRNSYIDLVGKKGFNETLCHGDIRLLFKHTPLSASYHNSASSSGRENAALQDDDMFGHDNTEADEPSVIHKPEKASKVHAFMRTNFHNVTYCKFCHKKIWLKTAFQCRKCLMVCHKKCTERCMLETICSNRKSSKMSLMSSQSEIDNRLQSRGSVSKIFVPNLSRLKRKSSNVSQSSQVSQNSNNSANQNTNNKYSVTDFKDFNVTLLNQKMKRRSLNNVSDLCANAAKEMGKELFSTMEPSDREFKLNEMISQVKDEIMKESMLRDQSGTGEITEYDERIETLNLLMLHYCSGLNHCLQEIAEATNPQNLDTTENYEQKLSSTTSE